MADLHPIAKRIHNAQPNPVRLTLEDGATFTFQFSATEFFQQEFRGEGVRADVANHGERAGGSEPDDGIIPGDPAIDDAEYRLITSEDYEHVLLGRKGVHDSGWTMVGRVTAVEPASH